MPNRLALPLIVLFLFCKAGYAKDFPGYYIKNSGDTVRCFFKFRDWSITPNSIDISADNVFSTVTPEDVAGFGIDGYGDYKSEKISYHKSNYTSLDAPDIIADSITTKFAFLKLLVKGKYTLYELAESSKSYFFYQENNGEVIEFVYKVKRQGMNIEEDNSFRFQLFKLFSNEHISYEFSNYINKSTYTRRSIKSLLIKLNEKVSGVKYAKKPKVTKFDLFAGVINNKFPTPYDGVYTSNNKIDPSNSVSAGLNLMYYTSSNFKRFAIGASAGFNSYSHSFYKSDSIVDYTSVNNHRTTKYTESHEFNNKVIMINLYGLAFLNPHDKVKVYLKAGFNTNFVFGSDNSINITYSSTTKGVRNGNVPVEGSSEGVGRLETLGKYYNINGGLGLNTGAHKLEFLYYTPGMLDYDFIFKVKMMGVYYYYTISR